MLRCLCELTALLPPMKWFRAALRRDRKTLPVTGHKWRYVRLLLPIHQSPAASNIPNTCPNVRPLRQHVHRADRPSSPVFVLFDYSHHGQGLLSPASDPPQTTQPHRLPPPPLPSIRTEPCLSRSHLHKRQRRRCVMESMRTLPTTRKSGLFHRQRLPLLARLRERLPRFQRDHSSATFAAILPR